MARPSFPKIAQAVRRDIADGTYSYELLTKLLFPMHQPLLHQHHPFIANTLTRAVSGHIMLTVCRLFDPDPNPRLASLTSFLMGVAAHHAKDAVISAKHTQWLEEFIARVEPALADIEARWRTSLVIRRSAYLAHRDLTKGLFPELTYADLRLALAWAKELYQHYAAAYQDVSELFTLPNTDREPPRFLEWCRLDDYEKHWRSQHGQTR